MKDTKYKGLILEETLTSWKEIHHSSLLDFQAPIAKIPTAFKRPIVISANPLTEPIDVYFDSSINVFIPGRQFPHILKKGIKDAQCITLYPVHCSLYVEL